MRFKLDVDHTNQDVQFQKLPFEGYFLYAIGEEKAIYKKIEPRVRVADSLDRQCNAIKLGGGGFSSVRFSTAAWVTPVTLTDIAVQVELKR